MHHVKNCWNSFFTSFTAWHVLADKKEETENFCDNFIARKKKKRKAWRDSKTVEIYANLQSENSNGFSHSFADYKNKEKREKDLLRKRKFSLNFCWHHAKLIQMAKCTHMKARFGEFIFGGHSFVASNLWRVLEDFYLIIFQFLRILKCVDSRSKAITCEPHDSVPPSLANLS